MTTIDKIMSAATELGDLRIMAANGRQSPGEISDATAELRDQISAAIADARREGAGEIERLRAALKATESDLFYQIEAKHGPQAASEYPAIKLAREALEHGND